MSGHIRGRGERSWELKYETGTDPGTGRRLTKYRNFKGTKREAQAELVRLMDTVRRGEHVDATKMTLAEYLDRWETGWAAVQVGPKTCEGYIDILRRHVRPYLGAMPPRPQHGGAGPLRILPQCGRHRRKRNSFIHGCRIA